MCIPKADWIWADFNGFFSGILCLSHSDTSQTSDGRTIELKAGMQVTAFMEDEDEGGNRDDLIASGIVEPSPEWLSCRGSRWILRIDGWGVRHESDAI
jgi:hypothetical protein